MKENIRRAANAHVALELHAQQGKMDGPETDPESAVRDLLTNLRHWCQREEIDFGEAVWMSGDHFNAEGGNAGLRTFTVVVEFNDEDAPDASNTYLLTIAAQDADSAGGAAIDELIRERGIDCDATEMDGWRAEYKCIAIYEGRHTNLVK